MARHGTKTHGELAENLVGKLERIEQRNAFEERLRSRSWKASEIEALKKEIFAADEDDSMGLLRTLSDCIAVAVREGRFDDDLTPTLANLRRQSPEGWLLTMPEVNLVYAVGRMMDSEAPWSGSDQGSSRPIPHEHAAGGWTFSLLSEGRIAAATKSLGSAIALDAIPSWAMAILRVSGGITEGWTGNDSMPIEPRFAGFRGSGSTPAEQRLVIAQARRWEAVEGSFRAVLRAIAAGAPIPDWSEGSTWVPIESANEWVKQAHLYERATDAALTNLARVDRQAVLATFSEAQRKALQAEANDPGSADAMKARAEAEAARRAANIPGDPKMLLHAYATGQLDH